MPACGIARGRVYGRVGSGNRAHLFRCPLSTGTFSAKQRLAFSMEQAFGLQRSLLRGLNSARFASNSARINLARSKAGQEIGEGAGRAIATRRLSEEIRIDSFPGRRRFDVTLNRQRER